MHRRYDLIRFLMILILPALLAGCESITDTNQTFAIHTGSVSGNPAKLTDCSAECDKWKNYIVEAPGRATMNGQL